MLKMALFDCAINEKCCSVDGGRSICPFFFRSHPGGFDSSRVPTPGNLSFKAKKKMPMPGDQPGELGAGGIDWCITTKPHFGTLWVKKDVERKDRSFCFFFGPYIQLRTENLPI